MRNLKFTAIMFLFTLLLMPIGDAVASVSKDKSNSDDPVVAEFKGKKIKKSEIMNAYNAIKAKMGGAVPIEQVYPILISQVVDDVILEDKASKSNLDKDPAVKMALERARAQILKTALMKKEIENNVTESLIRKEYAEFKKEFKKTIDKDEKEVHASHILVKTEKEAKDIIAKLEKGIGFEKLAREHSIDKASAVNGGDLGYFRKNKMVPEFAEAAFAMKKPGEYTKKPVQTAFGYHIIKYHGSRKVKVPSLEKMRPFLNAQAKAKVMSDYVKNLRKEYNVTFYDINGKNKIDPEKEALPFLKRLLGGAK